MALRFTIRNSDIERLQHLMDANPCPDKGRCWIVHLEVSPAVATFSFTNQRVQYPIDRHRTGYARIPDFAFRAAKRHGSERNVPGELQVSVGHGWLHYIGSTSDAQIEVGYVRDPGTGLVHYTSDGELIALGQILKDPSMLHPDLPEHIENANRSLEGALYSAARSLRNLGIMLDEVDALARLNTLVQPDVEALKPRLRKGFDTLGIENLWKS